MAYQEGQDNHALEANQNPKVPTINPYPPNQRKRMNWNVEFINSGKE